jgi:putative FmdB family regulatory protein
MPLYEYKCESCDAVFEVIQKFSDEPLATHPGCGGKVERLLSKAAFHLKGSGWYATDYAKSKRSGNSDSKKKEEKTESKPAESKPATSEPAPASAPAAEKK